MEHFLNSEWRLAAEAFLKLAETEPENLTHLTNAAYAQLKRSMYRRSIKLCDQVLKADKLCLRAYCIIAEAYVGMKKTSKAKKKLLEGLKAVESGHGSAPIDAIVVLQMRNALEEMESAGPDSKPKADHVPRAPSKKPAATAPPKQSNDSTIKLKKGGGSPAGSRAELAANASGQVNHGTGVKQIDQSIALGYLHVNTGKYAEAVAVFDAILSVSSNVYAARLGRGSAYALQGQFNKAIGDFNQAVKIKPNEADGYKRLGQVLGAAGEVDKAAICLGKAIELSKSTDSDSFQQRATIYQKNGNHRRALVDFRAAAKSSGTHGHTTNGNSLAVLWNYIGLCENALGNNLKAVQSYKKAIKFDGNFKEAYVNMGQAYRDYGMTAEARGAFESAMQTHRRVSGEGSMYVHVLHLRGLMHHGEGRYRLALNDFLDALIVQPRHVECRLMAGILLHGLGQFTEAIKHYGVLIENTQPETIDQVTATVRSDPSIQGTPGVGNDHGLETDGTVDKQGNKVAKFGSPSIWAWYQREVAIVCQSKLLDRPFREFHFGHSLNPLFKELLTKRSPPKDLLSSTAYTYTSVADAWIPADTPGFSARNVVFRCKFEGEGGGDRALQALVPVAQRLGKLLQLKSPGFLSNRRQHLQCGFAILEMAQALRREWALGAPTVVPGAFSSKPHGAPHEFGWRDLMDIAVKWRQFSEPNDPVFWIDYMTKEAFTEGFGLQTPMLTGQLRVPRYYPYFPKAFEALKGLVDQQCPLTDGLREQVYASKTGLDLYGVMKRDFWVVSPCYRLSTVATGESTRQVRSDPGKYLEGTRLTMTSKPPEGVEFTTRMPGLPERYKEYDAELRHVYELLRGQMAKLGVSKGEEGGNPSRLRYPGDLMLAYFYLWVTFAPLTRGSAATGYAVLYALFLAADMPIGVSPPSGVQADFEAFLEPRAETFIATIRNKWVNEALQSDGPDGQCLDWDNLPLVSETITTPRQLIEALNFSSGE
jgi:tetratricopeptide (TPR) repeat protein